MKDSTNEAGNKNHEPKEANGKSSGVYEEKTTFEDALKVSRHGIYNYRLLTITIYSLLAATAEMFTIGVVTTASQCDLDLDVEKKGLISSIPVLGVVVSAHFWGFLADTRGRRFTLMVTTTGACVAGIIATFANNWIFLAVIKFIGAIFASGTNALGYTFVGESTIAGKREQYLMYAFAGMLSFQAFNALMTYPILNLTFDYYMPLLGFSFRPWRLFLLVIGLLSGVNLLLITFYTYESPKFYFAIGEHDEGLKVMQKIYNVNTGNAVEDYPVQHVVLNADDYKTKKRNFIRSVWDQTIPLFYKKYIKTTVLIFLCGLPTYCVSPPFSIWLPFIFNAYSTSQDPDIQFCDIFQKNNTVPMNSSVIPVCDDSVSDLSIIALAVFAIYVTICCLGSVILIKLMGKKWTFVAIHVFTCAMCLLINHVKILYGLVALVGLTTNASGMGIVTAYAIDLFPTYMRAMAVCLCILSGRAASIVFFNVIGSQLENNCDNFLLMLAGLVLFGGIVGLFLPSDREQKVRKIPSIRESSKSPVAS